MCCLTSCRHLYTDTKAHLIRYLAYWNLSSVMFCFLNSFASNKWGKLLSEILYHEKNEERNDSKFNNTGIYQLNCSNRGKIYVRQKGKNFKTYYKEYLPRNRTGPKSANFADTLTTRNHINSIADSLDILHMWKV